MTKINMELVVASSIKNTAERVGCAESKKRIGYIDALRGFSMFCVVLMHFWNRFPMDIQHNIYFAKTEDVIFMFFLSLFFLISGFFSIRSFAGKQIVDKIITYIISPLFFSLLLDVFVSGKIHSLSEFATYRYYWFTIALFQMQVMTLPILLLRRYKLQSLVLLSLLLILCVPMIDRMPKSFISDILAWRKVYYYYPFYALGVICVIYKENFLRLLDNKWFRNGIVISFLSLLLMKGYFGGIPNMIISFLCQFAATLTIFLLFHSWQRFFRSANWFSRGMILVGRRTLDIYFIHYFFLPSTACLATILRGDNIITMMLLVGTIITVVVMGISMLIGQVIRLSPLLSRWLLGTK